MFIGLVGHSRVGKGRVAESLSELTSLPIRRFRDSLDDVLFDLTGLHWSNRKEDPVPELWKNDLVSLGRDMYKAVGEGMKTYLGEDVWIKAFFNRNKTSCIIEDVRYINQAEAIKGRGFLIRVDSSLETRVKRVAHKFQSYERAERYLLSLDRKDEVDRIVCDFLYQNEGDIDQVILNSILHNAGYYQNFRL